MNRRYYGISYDVHSDTRRRKIAKFLEKKGQRMQKSLFECLMTEKQFTETRQKLEKMIDHQTDNLRYYDLCLRCRHAIVAVGTATLPLEEPETMVI